MREILFRGKRTDNGEWVEGFYLFTKENTAQKVCGVLNEKLNKELI